MEGFAINGGDSANEQPKEGHISFLHTLAFPHTSYVMGFIYLSFYGQVKLG